MKKFPTRLLAFISLMFLDLPVSAQLYQKNVYRGTPLGDDMKEGTLSDNNQFLVSTGTVKSDATYSYTFSPTPSPFNLELVRMHESASTFTFKKEYRLSELNGGSSTPVNSTGESVCEDVTKYYLTGTVGLETIAQKYSISLLSVNKATGVLSVIRAYDLGFDIETGKKIIFDQANQIIYIVGMVKNVGGPSFMVILRVNTIGAISWVRIYSNPYQRDIYPEDAILYDNPQTGLQEIAVTGECVITQPSDPFFAFAGHNHGFMQRVDAPTGGALGGAYYELNGENMFLNRIRLDPVAAGITPRFLLCGSVEDISNNNFQFLAMSVNVLGAWLWSNVYHCSYVDNANNDPYVCELTDVAFYPVGSSYQYKFIGHAYKHSGSLIPNTPTTPGPILNKFQPTTLKKIVFSDADLAGTLLPTGHLMGDPQAPPTGMSAENIYVDDQTGDRFYVFGQHEDPNSPTGSPKPYQQEFFIHARVDLVNDCDVNDEDIIPGGHVAHHPYAFSSSTHAVNIKTAYSNTAYDMFVSDICPVMSFSSKNTATDIQAVAGRDKLKVYPNPAGSEVTIAMGDKGQFSQVTILDYTGKTVYTGGAGNQLRVDLGHFTPGIYLVLVTRDGVIVGSQKLVVEK